MNEQRKMEIEQAQKYREQVKAQIADLESMDTSYKPVVTSKDFSHKFLKDVADQAQVRSLTVYPSVIDEEIERELAARFSKTVKECIGISLSTEDLVAARKELAIFDLNKRLAHVDKEIAEMSSGVDVQETSETILPEGEGQGEEEGQMEEEVQLDPESSDLESSDSQELDSTEGESSVEGSETGSPDVPWS